MYKLTHNIGGASEPVPECGFEELHRQVHLVVEGETLHDAQHPREGGEDAEGRPATEPRVQYLTLIPN